MTRLQCHLGIMKANWGLKITPCRRQLKGRQGNILKEFALCLCSYRVIEDLLEFKIFFFQRKHFLKDIGVSVSFLSSA